MFFFLSKALLFFISPFVWFIAAILGIFFFKQARLVKICKISALAIFLLFTNTVIFLEFCRIWETPGRKIKDIPKYEVGIVLTGMAEYNNDLDVLSIRRGGDRIWQALNLYHAGKIKKILISGDSGYLTDRGLHEARQFKEVLVGWGVPDKDIITENTSRNTYENALETKKILDRSYPHIQKCLLITSATHMKRAKGCFDKVGLSCDMFSTDHHTGSSRNYYWDQYIIPSVNNFEEWNKLIKEWVGYLVYDLTNKI